MAVLWGLDLKEIHYNKFKSSYMWNSDYHLRRTKFIIYQLAMILCVVSESLGTAALSDYLTQQTFIKNFDGAIVHNNDIIGVMSYNIFAGIFVAFIFGGAFFFDLIWPQRLEDRGIRIAWKYSAIAACIFEAAAAFAITVVVARNSAYVTGVDAGEARRALEAYGGSPLDYSRNGRAVASVVFVWLGLVFVIASTILLWHSINHIEAHGALAAHMRDGPSAKEVPTNTSSPPQIAQTPQITEHNPDALPRHAQPDQISPLGEMIQADHAAEGNYNVATASTLNGEKKLEV